MTSVKCVEMCGKTTKLWIYRKYCNCINAFTLVYSLCIFATLIFTHTLEKKFLFIFLWQFQLHVRMWSMVVPEYFGPFFFSNDKSDIRKNFKARQETGLRNLRVSFLGIRVTAQSQFRMMKLKRDTLLSLRFLENCFCLPYNINISQCHLRRLEKIDLFVLLAKNSS